MKYINRVFFLLLGVLAFALTSCSEKSVKAAENKVDESFSLVGKHATIEYPEMKAEIQYLSDSTLHWKTTSLENEVHEATEKMSYKQVADGLFFVNWIEQDGITVSQVLDSKKGIVSVYLSFADKESDRGERSAIFMEGKVTFN